MHVLQVFAITWDAAVVEKHFLFVPFGNMTFVGKHIRVIPETNAGGLYSQKFRFEVHGCRHPFGSPAPAPCKYNSGPDNSLITADFGSCPAAVESNTS